MVSDCPHSMPRSIRERMSIVGVLNSQDVAQPKSERDISSCSSSPLIGRSETSSPPLSLDTSLCLRPATAQSCDEAPSYIPSDFHHSRSQSSYKHGHFRTSSSATRRSNTSSQSSRSSRSSSSPVPKQRKKRNSYPPYSTEEQYFILYCKNDLGMDWNQVQAAYLRQFPTRDRSDSVQGLQCKYYRFTETLGIPKVREYSRRSRFGEAIDVRQFGVRVIRPDIQYSWMR